MSEMRYWKLPQANDAPAFWRAGKPIGHDRFQQDIQRAQQVLSRLESPKIVLSEPDVYAFCVWLMAAWSLGITVILPGENPKAMEDLRALPQIAPLRGGDLSTTLDGPAKNGHPQAPLRGGDLSTELDSLAKNYPPQDLQDFGAPSLIVFTSGSSGQPNRIEKSLQQLRREIEALEEAFGGFLSPGKTRFVRSVPHPHMYGLPFAVLWPLSFAYPIVVEKLRYPEDLWHLPAADYALVSAPTFLRYLCSLDYSIKNSLPPTGRWQLATSAGSPLPPETQAHGQDLLGAPLFEIYGSTETGATARRQSGKWQAMPGVRLFVEDASGRLCIQSPFLAPEYEKEGFLSNDLARIDAEGLELLGRSDRVIKIGEKRVSLRQVETALTALAEIHHAVAVPLHDNVLGMVVILTDAGKHKKETMGKALFDRHLRTLLRDRLEALALPRRWRYVDALPMNPMGKTTQHDLQQLFAPHLPKVTPLRGGDLSTELDRPTKSRCPQDPQGQDVCLQLQLAPDIIWFEGHFPHLPVLPGVVQIDWAAHFGRLHFNLDATRTPVTRMMGLKFQHLIRPGDTLRLDLSWRADKRELEFTYRLDEKICSRGTLVLQALAQ
jgi:3-hydroxymyristoyl/3-hydroxydecanoyl-(acyl carrier protein) dehydratase